MTCKDCLHAEVCEEYGEVFSLIKGGKCSLFKDRSRFVELSCKLGDTLFVPTRNFVSEYKIVSLIDILSRTSSSVKEIQEQFINIYGVAPDRKTLYQDLAAIEKHYPLHVSKKNRCFGMPKYSL